MNTTLDTARSAALRSIEIMADGNRPEFDEVVAPGAVNHEGAIEPPACRVGGPQGYHATSLWLRAAFADLNHHVEHVVAQDALVVVDTTRSGPHVGPFVLYDSQGAVETVWAPTGKTFAVRQSHWLQATAWSSSTGRFPTILARAFSTAGSRPARSTCSAVTGPNVEPYGHPQPADLVPGRSAMRSLLPHRALRSPTQLPQTGALSAITAATARSMTSVIPPRETWNAATAPWATYVGSSASRVYRTWRIPRVR